MAPVIFSKTPGNKKDLNRSASLLKPFSSKLTAWSKVMEIETLTDKLFDLIDRIKTEECIKRDNR